jgi:hypothetical protein
MIPFFIFHPTMMWVAAFSDLESERSSIEVPRIGIDVNVTCGGKEIAIEVSPHYIQRNSAWLGDGSFLRILLTMFLAPTYKIFTCHKTQLFHDFLVWSPFFV